MTSLGVETGGRNEPPTYHAGEVVISLSHRSYSQRHQELRYPSAIRVRNLSSPDTMLTGSDGVRFDGANAIDSTGNSAKVADVKNDDKPDLILFAGAVRDLKAGAQGHWQQAVHAIARASGTNGHGPAPGAPVPSGSTMSGAARAAAAPLRRFPGAPPPGQPLGPS